MVFSLGSPPVPFVTVTTSSLMLRSWSPTPLLFPSPPPLSPCLVFLLITLVAPWDFLISSSCTYKPSPKIWTCFILGSSHTFSQCQLPGSIDGFSQVQLPVNVDGFEIHFRWTFFSLLFNFTPPANSFLPQQPLYHASASFLLLM